MLNCLPKCFAAQSKCSSASRPPAASNHCSSPSLNCKLDLWIVLNSFIWFNYESWNSWNTPLLLAPNWIWELFQTLSSDSTFFFGSEAFVARWSHLKTFWFLPLWYCTAVGFDVKVLLPDLKTLLFLPVWYCSGLWCEGFFSRFENTLISTTVHCGRWGKHTSEYKHRKCPDITCEFFVFLSFCLYQPLLFSTTKSSLHLLKQLSWILNLIVLVSQGRCSYHLQPKLSFTRNHIFEIKRIGHPLIILALLQEMFSKSGQ